MPTNTSDDTGVVFRKTTGHYTVHANGRELDCGLSSLIRKQLIYPIADPTSLRHRVQEVREINHVDPIAIGDQVRFMDSGQDRGRNLQAIWQSAGSGSGDAEPHWAALPGNWELCWS